MAGKQKVHRMNRHIQHLSSGAGKRRARGVTLIELLITVAIVAIIAAIAIPSYNTYVLRTHRTEAKSALLSMAAAEERLYSTLNAYSTTADAAGLYRRVSDHCRQRVLSGQHSQRSSGDHDPPSDLHADCHRHQQSRRRTPRAGLYHRSRGHSRHLHRHAAPLRIVGNKTRGHQRERAKKCRTYVRHFY